MVIPVPTPIVPAGTTGGAGVEEVLPPPRVATTAATAPAAATSAPAATRVLYKTSERP